MTTYRERTSANGVLSFFCSHPSICAFLAVVELKKHSFFTILDYFHQKMTNFVAAF